jgi:hypothetical protein
MTHGRRSRYVSAGADQPWSGGCITACPVVGTVVGVACGCPRIHVGAGGGVVSPFGGVVGVGIAEAGELAQEQLNAL